jgi:hypothetical protein
MPDAGSAPAPRETYFVIVSGAMNPAIHHAQWYRNIGAIDEAELQASLRVPTNSTSPLLSQVQFGSPPLTVICQPETWWIQSSNASSWLRMLDITALVFARLNETPVTAYGMTSQRHLDTVAPDTKSVLAESIWELKLGFPEGARKSSASNITLSVIEEDYIVSVSLQPSLLSERAIFVFLNCQYPSPKGPTGGYFDLGVVLKSRFAKYQGMQERICAEMVTVVNTLAARRTSK